MFRRMVRKTSCGWDEVVGRCISHLESQYTLKEHGLNLSDSGFVKSEVYKADECIYVDSERGMLGFVFLLTTKRPRALYITLMASFETGIGSKILTLLETSLLYTHEFLGLRATPTSVGFYIKKGYKVFDFISLEDYVNGKTDDALTRQIESHIQNKTELQKLQKTIVHRNWIPETSDEFPLLKKRETICKNSIRTSPRLSG